MNDKPVPQISVIVPTCNRLPELTLCLERLSPVHQRVSLGTYEVIVTDDGRQAPAKSVVESRFPSVRWVEGPGRGPAANRNHGASHARASWLVFIDDDCIAEPNLLETYASLITRCSPEDRVVLHGATVPCETGKSLLWEAPNDPEGRAGITANFAISRQLLDHVGRFDERYPVAAFEDTEFFSRLNAMGVCRQSVPDACVKHPLRKVPSPSRLASRWEGRVIYALDQGASPWTVLWRLPWHVGRIIQSRIGKRSWSFSNLIALLVFTLEWLCVAVRTPCWIAKWRRRPRSPFWVEYVKSKGHVPKYGF